MIHHKKNEGFHPFNRISSINAIFRTTWFWVTRILLYIEVWVYFRCLTQTYWCQSSSALVITDWQKSSSHRKYLSYTHTSLSIEWLCRLLYRSSICCHVFAMLDVDSRIKLPKEPSTNYVRANSIEIEPFPHVRIAYVTPRLFLYAKNFLDDITAG